MDNSTYSDHEINGPIHFADIEGAFREHPFENITEKVNAMVIEFDPLDAHGPIGERAKPIVVEPCYIKLKISHFELGGRGIVTNSALGPSRKSNVLADAIVIASMPPVER